MTSSINLIWPPFPPLCLLGLTTANNGPAAYFETVFIWYRIKFYPVIWHWVSLFVYIMTPKLFFCYKSFRNEFITVVAPDRNDRSGTKSSCTFHKYYVNEWWAHSGTRLGKWISWVDQLTHPLLCKMWLQYVSRTGMKYIPLSRKQHLRSIAIHILEINITTCRIFIESFS